MGLIHGYRKQRLSVAVTLGGDGGLNRFPGSARSGLTVGGYQAAPLLKEDRMFDEGKLPSPSWLGGSLPALSMKGEKWNGENYLSESRASVFTHVRMGLEPATFCSPSGSDDIISLMLLWRKPC